METFISLISDLLILILDLTLYAKLTKLKKENNLYRGLMYGGTSLITLAYVTAVYVLHFPYAVSSFVCMTVPSFVLFFCLSKYKNARFLVNFCFVDTVSFIIAACGKFILVVGGLWGGVISFSVMLVLSAATYFSLRPYFARYRELMDRVSKGWAPMAVSTVLIYVLLVFTAVLPSPIVERMEYAPMYILLCLTVLSFYGVFIILIQQKAQLTRANILLHQQQHWHDLAYMDELTKLANQASYDARTAELEKEKPRELYAVIIFDIDDFKHFNDTYGHLVGNEVLRKAAQFFLTSFSENHYEFFRIGGDEFAAIVSGLPEAEIRQAVNRLNLIKLENTMGCSFSCGYAMVDFSRKDSFRQAFSQADQAMYTVKTEKKEKSAAL